MENKQTINPETGATVEVIEPKKGFFKRLKESRTGKIIAAILGALGIGAVAFVVGRATSPKKDEVTSVPVAAPELPETTPEEEVETDTETESL